MTMVEIINQAFQNFGKAVSDWPFWVSAVTVIMFAHNRFGLQNLSQDGQATLDPPVPSRSFTTRFRYRMSEFIYATIYWVFYIVLISFGSFEWFQDFLMKVAGTLTDGGGEKLASPAWAALFATSILPSVPGFKALDKNIRLFLHDFSSIPIKAHRLADDIYDSLTSQFEGRKSYENLKEIIENFPHKETVAYTTRQYCAVRKENQPFLDETFSKLDRMKYNKQEPHEPHDPEGYKELLMRLCRYLSCALLLCLPDERIARKKLIANFSLNKLPLIGWQFRMQQVFLSILLILAVMGALGLVPFVAWGVGQFTEIKLPYIQAMDLPHAKNILFMHMGWSVYAIFMFILPLVFTAGIKLYLTDKKRYREKNSPEDVIPLEDNVLSGAVVFLGSFFLAFLPVLISIPYMHYNFDVQESTSMILKTISWGIPPAIFAVVFLFRSSKKPKSNAIGSYIADFLWHSVPVFLFSSLLLFTSSPHISGMAIRPEEFKIMVMLVSFFLPGFLGASNSLISKRPLYEQMTAENESWTLPENTILPKFREKDKEERQETDAGIAVNEKTT